MANEPEPPIATPGNPEQPPKSDDLADAIAREQAKIAGAAAEAGGGGSGGQKADRCGFISFVSSGFFFMLVGGGFLFIAAQTMGPTHAMFSFVLVVVGVAILLFGTGTQSVGEFESKRDETSYKTKIAGGAGVLAFCIAAGIVYFHPKMKAAFQIEKKYFVVKVQPLANSTFEDYVAQFSIEGTPIPSMLRGNFMMVYVPYLESEEKTKRPVQYRFRYIGKKLPELQRDDVTLAFDVEINNDYLERRDAGLDFPVYCKLDTEKKNCVPIEVNLQSSRSAQDQANEVAKALPPENQRPSTGQENVPHVAPPASQF